MGPIEALDDQWDGVGSPAPKDDGRDGDTLGILEVPRQERVVDSRGGEAAVGVGGLLACPGSPRATQPIPHLALGHLICLAFPPYVSIFSQRNVGVDCVLKL